MKPAFWVVKLTGMGGAPTQYASGNLAGIPLLTEDPAEALHFPTKRAARDYKRSRFPNIDGLTASTPPAGWLKAHGYAVPRQVDHEH